MSKKTSKKKDKIKGVDKVESLPLGSPPCLDGASDVLIAPIGVPDPNILNLDPLSVDGHARGILIPEEISSGDGTLMKANGEFPIHLVVEVGSSLESRTRDDTMENSNLFIQVRAKNKKRNSPNGHSSTPVSSGVKTRN